jgi:hypothetical protein
LGDDAEPATIPPLLAIGDSIMLSAEPLLRAVFDEQIVIDSAVGRSFAEGIPILESLAVLEAIPDIVLVHLGTNNPVYDGQFETMMEILRDVPHVVFVNVRMPFAWEPISNKTLREGVARWRNATLLDWHQLSADADHFFALDGVHIGRAGAEGYTELLRDGVAQLQRFDAAASEAVLAGIQIDRS